MNFCEFPFVRLAISFILGIGLSFHFPGELNSFLLLIFVSVILAVLTWIFAEYPIAVSVFLFFILFLSGMAVCQIHLQGIQNNPIPEYKGVFLEGYVTSRPVYKNWNRMSFGIRRYKLKNGNAFRVNKKIQLFISPDSSLQIKKGDRLVIFGQLVPVKTSKNPHAFNYGEYLKLEGITHQVFIKKIDILTQDVSSGPYYRYWLLQCQAYLNITFEKTITKFDHLSIVKAMILGDKREIDESLYRQFSQTGSLHLLAVSGLHVGIIFFGFSSLLSWLKLDRSMKILTQLILPILILWSYAFITGGQPAVLRASFMFSVYVVAKNTRRTINIYNTLAFTAFILLTYDPLLLFKPGFQFSFLALSSIVFFYPKFYGLVTISNALLDKVWSLLCVAVSAQILIFPFSLYYFQSFSLYFWLSGIILVPFTGLIISLSLIIALLNLIMPIAVKLAAILLDFTLSVFLKSLKIIASLPYCSIDGLYLKSTELYISILCLAILICAFRYKKQFISHALLLIGSLYLIYTSYDSANSKSQSKLFIYHSNKSLVIDLFSGQRGVSIQKNTNEDEITFISRPNRLHHNIQSMQKKESNYFSFKQDWFYITTRSEKAVPQVIDYLIVYEGHLRNWENLIHKHCPKKIIVSPNTGYRKALQIKKLADNLEIPVHNIARDGFLELD